MPPATCHLPPVARKHLTPRTLPRPALTCHGSWCIQANAVPHTRCIILCLSFLSGTSPTPTRRPLSSSRFILFYFFSHSQASLAHAFRLSSFHAHRIFSYIFFWPARVKLSIDTFHTHTYSTCRMRGCVAIIVANEHFYLPHLGVTIMSTISGVFNGALYLLSV